MAQPDPSLEARWREVGERVATACRRFGRPPSDVTLVGVSKRQPLERLTELARLGLRDFGENQVQAWRARMEALPDRSLRWHLIGPIQTNKARYVARTPPALLHTVDWPELVAALAARLDPAHPLDCLIQVDIDREPQKAGCAPEALGGLADLVSAAPTLRLCGVMCIPRYGPAAETREAFARLRHLGESIADRLGGRRLELSMGMSGDFEEAIEEGATLIRVGTALFGARD